MFRFRNRTGDSTSAEAFKFSIPATNHGLSSAPTPRHHPGDWHENSAHTVSTVEAINARSLG